MARKAFELSPEASLSPEEVWKIAKARLDAMTREERVGTLKEAGILTKSGRVARPYRGVIVMKSGKTH